MSKPLSNIVAPDNFDFTKYAKVNAGNFVHAGWRRTFTRNDPFLFAWIYLPHHLDPFDTGTASLAPFHVDFYNDMAEYWTIKSPRPMEVRRTYHLMRESGKSTCWCLVNPIWAHAHGHVHFTVILTHATELAEMHMETLKKEFYSNALLQMDYPDLCEALRTPENRSAGDTKQRHMAASGDIILARGMDKANLGIKIGKHRPDNIILDDIQPPAAEFGEKARKARLDNVQNVILPINIRAKVAWLGTTVKRGCLVHELVKAANKLPHENWVEGQNFKPHHYPPFVRNADGQETSIWPEKWPNKIRAP
jgi:hypothetical protein